MEDCNNIEYYLDCVKELEKQKESLSNNSKYKDAIKTRRKIAETLEIIKGLRKAELKSNQDSQVK